jgi:hypothetical protein
VVTTVHVETFPMATRAGRRPVPIRPTHASLVLVEVVNLRGDEGAAAEPRAARKCETGVGRRVNRLALHARTRRWSSATSK